MRSTGGRTTTGRTRLDWLTIGILGLALGLGAVALSAPWVWLDQGGWPWTDSISQVGSGYEVTITHPGGKSEAFLRATYDDAIAWMDRRNGELKHAYHLDTKIAVGRVLMTLGGGLATAGGSVLIWRLVRASRGRGPGNGGAVSAA